jgi:hypothetical protein
VHQAQIAVTGEEGNLLFHPCIPLVEVTYEDNKASGTHHALHLIQGVFQALVWFKGLVWIALPRRVRHHLAQHAQYCILSQLRTQPEGTLFGKQKRAEAIVVLKRLPPQQGGEARSLHGLEASARGKKHRAPVIERHQNRAFRLRWRFSCTNS